MFHISVQLFWLAVGAFAISGLCAAFAVVGRQMRMKATFFVGSYSAITMLLTSAYLLYRSVT